jgi:hypothetical protein
MGGVFVAWLYLPAPGVLGVWSGVWLPGVCGAVVRATLPRLRWCLPAWLDISARLPLSSGSLPVVCFASVPADDRPITRLLSSKGR